MGMNADGGRHRERGCTDGCPQVCFSKKGAARTWPAKCSFQVSSPLQAGTEVYWTWRRQNDSPRRRARCPSRPLRQGMGPPTSLSSASPPWECMQHMRVCKKAAEDPYNHEWCAPHGGTCRTSTCLPLIAESDWTWSSGLSRLAEKRCAEAPPPPWGKPAPSTWRPPRGRSSACQPSSTTSAL